MQLTVTQYLEKIFTTYLSSQIILSVTIFHRFIACTALFRCHHCVLLPVDGFFAFCITVVFAQVTKLRQMPNLTRFPQTIRILIRQSIKACCILERKVIQIEIQARVIFPLLMCLLLRPVSCNSTFLSLTPNHQDFPVCLVGKCSL